MRLADLLITLNPSTYRKEHREIMTGIDRLQAAVTKLNETITTEAEQQKAAIQKLRDEIANGSDSATLNQLADDIEASIDRVKAIVPDDVEETPQTSVDNAIDGAGAAVLEG